MLSRRRRARSQRNLLLLALCLAAYYLAVYRPLSARVSNLIPPLQQAQAELATIDPAAARNLSLQLDYAQAELEKAQNQNRLIQEIDLTAGARIEPDAVTRARIGEPFQLLAFQNERKTHLEELSRIAAKSKTTLSPEVVQGFPEYYAEIAYPQLLWPQLQLCQFLTTGAIQCGASTIHSIQLYRVQFHPSASDQQQWLAELSANIELSGPANNLAKYLEQLPLRAGEIKDRNLPETQPSKPVIFIRGLVMRKEGRTPPDQTHLELTASCFIRFNRNSD
jgi:hypothetical protein